MVGKLCGEFPHTKKDWSQLFQTLETFFPRSGTFGISALFCGDIFPRFGTFEAAFSNAWKTLLSGGLGEARPTQHPGDPVILPCLRHYFARQNYAFALLKGGQNSSLRRPRRGSPYPTSRRPGYPAVPRRSFSEDGSKFSFLLQFERAGIAFSIGDFCTGEVAGLRAVELPCV